MSLMENLIKEVNKEFKETIMQQGKTEIALKEDTMAAYNERLKELKRL